MSETWAREQVEKFTFDFDQADTDKSGSLSYSEVVAVLRKVGFNGTDEEAKKIFEHFDKGGDDKVSREEFKTALIKLPRFTIKEFVLRKTFVQLDKDGSGYLTRSEIMDGTKTVEGGVDISADVVSDLLIYSCGRDDDDKVHYNEFLEVLGIEETGQFLRQIFARMDKNGDGTMCISEIIDAIEGAADLKLCKTKLLGLIDVWWQDKDAVINYDEFVQYWTKQKKPATVEEKADESEAEKKADESEAEKKADESEAEKKTDESEAEKKADESEAEKKADESEAEKKADGSEAEKKADESEAEKKADESEAEKPTEAAEAKKEEEENKEDKKTEKAETEKNTEEKQTNEL